MSFAATKTSSPSLLDCKVTALLKTYERVERVWKASSFRQSLLALLEAKMAKDGKHVENALIVALGPMEKDCQIYGDPRHDYNYDPLIQLAAFNDMHASLESATGRRIPKHAQDPAFTEVDHAILQHFDIEVLEEPDAEGMTSDDLFVFAPHHFHDEAFLGNEDSERPRLYIGLRYFQIVRNTLHSLLNAERRQDQKWSEEIRLTRKELDHLRDVSRTYDRIHLHDVEFNFDGDDFFPFCNLVLYCRRNSKH